MSESAKSIIVQISHHVCHSFFCLLRHHSFSSHVRESMWFIMRVCVCLYALCTEASAVVAQSLKMCLLHLFFHLKCYFFCACVILYIMVLLFSEINVSLLSMTVINDCVYVIMYTLLV